ncbi:hypothetical protein EYZ11_000173 [Aspergillus tanneri]|uniref:Uncharacterized protein n=1 Tax=Aspergillus tanneri TaxID=1220188 RepID=A0A4S3JXL1_9EURO|nr:hypothetical protein EYZ11_000173 [Aspergillus tanneri]
MVSSEPYGSNDSNKLFPSINLPSIAPRQYSAAASGSDTKVTRPADMSAFKATLMIASFAISDQTEGTVSCKRP